MARRIARIVMNVLVAAFLALLMLALVEYFDLPIVREAGGAGTITAAR